MASSVSMSRCSAAGASAVPPESSGSSVSNGVVVVEVRRRCMVARAGPGPHRGSTVVDGVTPAMHVYEDAAYFLFAAARTRACPCRSCLLVSLQHRCTCTTSVHACACMGACTHVPSCRSACRLRAQLLGHWRDGALRQPDAGNTRRLDVVTAHGAVVAGLVA